MKCTECQLQIFGREPGEADLSPAAMTHIVECADCRALDQEVRLNTMLLAGLRDEPLPAARRPWNWQPWAAAIAAAAAAIALVLSVPRDFPHPPTIQPPDIVRAVDPPPPVVAEVLPSAPPVKPRPRVRRPPPVVAQPLPKPEHAAEPVAEQPLLVKFITDDPEVVVYWIVDPNQGVPGL